MSQKNVQGRWKLKPEQLKYAALTLVAAKASRANGLLYIWTCWQPCVVRLQNAMLIAEYISSQKNSWYYCGKLKLIWTMYWFEISSRAVQLNLSHLFSSSIYLLFSIFLLLLSSRITSSRSPNQLFLIPVGEFMTPRAEGSRPHYY